MRNETIRRAYDSVLPDAGAKERMLRNILSEASNAPPEGNVVKMKTRNIRKTILILAAVLAAALSVTVIAYATDLFGFRSVMLDESVKMESRPDLKYRISLAQPQDVPDGLDPDIAERLDKNSQALAEWEERKPSLNDTEDMRYMSKYDIAYRILSPEEEALLEEITEKYGLTLRNQMTLLHLFHPHWQN